MRQSIIALLLGVAACGVPKSEQSEKAEAPVVVAALTFDGADATDAAAALKHGERMSWMLGCKGCHGENLQGTNVTADVPNLGDMNAPNLTLLLANYSDADLDKVVRHGVPKDGREFWFMPSETFQYVSDADFAALITYLRTVKPGGKPMPPIRKGPKFLDDVAKGAYTNAPGMIKRFQASQPADLGESHALGRYIAMTTCTECHNSELQGYEGFSPNLDLAGAYSADELTTLLTTGKGKIKPDLGLMSETAKHRFSKLTPRERTAIVAYIKARADRPQ